ncbi:DnaJ domain-containing protein [Acinetobacter baumannii]
MNLYEILHISQDAPEEIIKLAYKGLAQKYHPDRYKGDDANEIMVKIREAYETLIDPEKRKNYDQFLAEQARRKQQQEEYVKKQQQEEFIRAQKAAFERQNKTSSSSNTQHEQQPQNKDSKSFKMNISIDVPSNFSIFSPFIKIKNWLVSKKTFFIKAFFTCITLFILVLVGNVVRLVLERNSSNVAEQTTEEVAKSEATATPEIESTGKSYNSYSEEEQAAIDANNAALAAVQAADDDLNMYAGPQDENLTITNKKLEYASKLAFNTFKQSGMSGLEQLVSNCYKQNLGSDQCIYLDFAGKYMNDSGTAIGLPEYEYFKGEAVLDRIYKNFYSFHQYDADIADTHASETLKKMYASMEKLFN